MKKLFSTFISLAILVVAIYFLARLAPLFLKELGPKTGDGRPAAPDFSLPDPGGRAIKLSDFRGKTVILGFWTSWNERSVEQLKILNDYQKYSPDENAVVLGVNSQEDGESAKAVLDRENIRMIETLLDKDGEVGEQYGVGVLPLTVFVDGEGREAARIVGPAGLAEIRERAAVLRKR